MATFKKLNICNSTIPVWLNFEQVENIIGPFTGYGGQVYSKVFTVSAQNTRYYEIMGSPEEILSGVGDASEQTALANKLVASKLERELYQEHFFWSKMESSDEAKKLKMPLSYQTKFNHLIAERIKLYEEWVASQLTQEVPPTLNQEQP